MKWIKDFYVFCTKVAQNKWAMPFLGIFSFFESIIIPIPADPLLIAVCASRPKASVKAFLWTLIGSLLGATVGYSLGLYFSNTVQELLLKYLISQDQWNYLIQLFSKGTFLFLFIAGFTPLPFKVFAVTAGILNGAFLPFFLGALAGRGLRFGVISILFYFYGREIKSWIEKNFEKTVWITTAVITIIFIIYISLTSQH